MLELDGIVGNGADFHQLGSDDVRISRSNSSMARVGGWNRHPTRGPRRCHAPSWIPAFGMATHPIAGDDLELCALNRLAEPANHANAEGPESRALLLYPSGEPTR